MTVKHISLNRTKYKINFSFNYQVVDSNKCVRRVAARHERRPYAANRCSHAIIMQRCAERVEIADTV